MRDALEVQHDDLADDLDSSSRRFARLYGRAYAKLVSLQEIVEGLTPGPERRVLESECRRLLRRLEVAAAGASIELSRIGALFTPEALEVASDG